MIELHLISTAFLNANPFDRRKGSKPGDAKTRVEFQFSDHGEVIHPTMIIMVQKPNGDWDDLAEVDFLKSELQMAIDICNRLEGK